VACVPLPAPGAPNRISLIVFLFRFQGPKAEAIWARVPAPSVGYRGPYLRIARDPLTQAYKAWGQSARTRVKSSGVSTPAAGVCSVM
jgi:hypothetical protein